MRRRIARVSSTRGAPPFVLRRPSTSSSSVDGTAPRDDDDERTSERPNICVVRPCARTKISSRASERASDRATRSICGAHRWRRRSRATVRIPPCAHTTRRVDAARTHAERTDGHIYPPHPSRRWTRIQTSIDREPRTARALLAHTKSTTHARTNIAIAASERARARSRQNLRPRVRRSVGPAVLEPHTQNIASANRDQAVESPDARDRCARMARSMRAIDGCARASMRAIDGLIDRTRGRTRAKGRPSFARIGARIGRRRRGRDSGARFGRRAGARDRDLYISRIAIRAIGIASPRGEQHTERG